MIDLVESFNNAFRLQQEGRLIEAETLYRAVLDVAPEHPGSHHLLGLVEHRLGRHDAALQSIKRAIELNDSEPNYHNNLGTVSNHDEKRGYATIAEARSVEEMKEGMPKTPFLQYGDRVRIEMLDAQGQSIFGAIDHKMARTS